MDFTDYFQQQFRNRFKTQRIHAIRAMVDSAYENADKLYHGSLDDNLFCATLIGKDIWADVLRASIACAGKVFCKKGILPYRFATPENLARNIHHVRFDAVDDAYSLYLARVEYPQENPHSALYRPKYNDIRISLFDNNDKPEKRVDTFTATYGDGGDHVFKYGNIGILGENSWLYHESLDSGAYQYTTKQDNDDMLVEFDETFKKFLEKDDESGGGKK